MTVKVVCDFCDRPLELEDNRYVIYRTKQINTLNLFPHLCKNCSEKLDVVFENFRETKINKLELIAKYRRLNQERREKLGTKG